MNIFISGASGFIGSNLLKYLGQKGHSCIPLKVKNDLDEKNFNDVDAIVHLAGESITHKRWSPQQKLIIATSRIKGTQHLSKIVTEFKNPPKIFLSASAIGFYGDRGDELLDETSKPGSGFLSATCQEWEKATRLTENSGIRVIHLRTGIVLGKQGGALSQMLAPFKWGLGGKLGNGKQWMSWISLVDEIRAIEFLLNTPTLSGPFNLVSPHPVTNQEFTKTLGQVLRRPTIFPIPSFLLKIMFGEMAKATFLASAKVLPKKLMEAGFEFNHPTLKEALQEILKKKGTGT